MPTLSSTTSRLDSGDECGLGFCGWHGERYFRAADVFETIVGARGNGVFPGRQRGQDRVVVFDERVAYGFVRRKKNPLTTVQAVLRTLDRRGSVTRGEIGGMAATHLAGSWPNLEALDHRWRVADFKAFAFPCGLARRGGRIRRRIGGHEFQVVGAVRQCGGIPGIEFLLEIVLQ